MARVGRERGFAPPTKESFAYDIGPDGALYGTQVIPRVRELLEVEEAATANVEPAHG